MSQQDLRLIAGVYRIGQVISDAPMLVTATANNRNTNDVVGINLIEVPAHHGQDDVERLFQDLEQRRQVISPHVLRVHDWGVEGQRVYIVTDPPRGVTLRYVLDSEDLSLMRILDITSQLLQGLQSLEGAKLYALDLRPFLITVDTVGPVDRVQIDDVGLRVFLNALGCLDTRDTEALAYRDPRYAPPEYIDATPIGSYSGVYQVGLLLFEMITGRLPFIGKDAAETGVMQRFKPVPQLKKYKNDTPPAWQMVLDRALAKQPGERFPNAGAFLEDLEMLRSEHTTPISSISVASTQYESSRPTGSGTDLTREMTVISHDQPVTSQGTQIDLQRRREEPGFVAPSEEGVYAYLYPLPVEEESQPLPLKKKSVVVGRLDPKRKISPDIDLSAFDPRMTVSRQHARIRFEEGLFSIEDLKSHNKTRLGALTLQAFTPALLQHGDTVRFGSVSMVFRLPGVRDTPKISKDIP